MKQIFDVLIIGAGAVGCSVARELSRYQIKTAVLEKESDVAAGTSGRNSAVVHAGFNNKPGSLMARFCVEGSQGFEALCQELDVPYHKTGKLLVAFDDEDIFVLEGLIRQGEENGCEGLRMIDQQTLHKMTPNVAGIAAMESPNTAIFDPFIYTVALAENAVENGARFLFNQEVLGISKENNLFTVRTQSGEYCCKVLVNCAGLHSDQVAAMAGLDHYKIYPCRGEYLILDKSALQYLDIPVYPAPRSGIGGLGVHLTPTVHGNILIGPDAEYIDGREDCATTKANMDELFRQAQLLLPLLQRKDIIGAYSGIRAKRTPPDQGGFGDFIIQAEPDMPGLIDLIGIESPGITASAPIARYVVKMIAQTLPLNENPHFNPTRRSILRFAEQTPEVKAQLIAEDSDYGEIICRCQQITKAEIRQAIENPLGATSITAIKYRAWPTTGRCQGGYCLTRIAQMLEQEYGIEPEHITQRGEGSELFSGRVK